MDSTSENNFQIRQDTLQSNKKDFCYNFCHTTSQIETGRRFWTTTELIVSDKCSYTDQFFYDNNDNP